jgi:hypothetical protein
MEMVLTMGIYFTYNTQRGARTENKQRNASDMVKASKPKQQQTAQYQKANHKPEFQDRNVIKTHPKNLDPKDVCPVNSQADK